MVSIHRRRTYTSKDGVGEGGDDRGEALSQLTGNKKGGDL